MAWSVSKRKYSYQKMMAMLKPVSKAEIIEQMRVAYEYFPMENKEIEDFIHTVIWQKRK